MKSAYEIAMGRLEKEAPLKKLDPETKARLAEIDSEYDAKVAEKRVFLEGEMAKAAGDPMALESLRVQLASEVARIEEKREAKKNAIREGRNP